MQKQIKRMDTFDFNVEEKLRPSVERTLTGTTALDTKIASLPIPKEGRLIKWSVLILRKYRRIAPHSLRCRCVFEPSCSHYSELAVRQHGILLGIKYTVSRLRRCNRKNGGKDLTNLNKEIL